MVNSSRRVRICYLLPELKWGGSEKHVIHLARGLRERGYDTEIVCLFREGILAGEAREGEIPLTCLNLPYQWGFRTFYQILKWIRANPIDVLHTCLFGFHFFAASPARFLGIPTILASQREIPHWQKRRHRLLSRLGNLFVDRVVSCSKAAERWVLEKEKICPEKVLTLYNGVDLAQFNPFPADGVVRRQFGIPENAPLIGTVANFAFEKGYPYLLDAVQTLLTQDPSLWFLLVGSGPFENEIKKKARQIPNHRQIIFAGHRSNIPRLLASLDVFLLASVMEGFPNVLLEAMAMAKPVIATGVGGIPELIESGKNGILVPPKNGEALAQAVLSLLKDRKKAEAMGSAAEELIRRSFTLDRMIDQYENLYLSLLQKGEPQTTCAALSA